jgi:hypothetical protein
MFIPLVPLELNEVSAAVQEDLGEGFFSRRCGKEMFTPNCRLGLTRRSADFYKTTKNAEAQLDFLSCVR